MTGGAIEGMIYVVKQTNTCPMNTSFRTRISQYFTS